MRTSVLRPPEAAHNYQRRPPPASSTNLRPGWSLPLPGPASVFHLDIKGPPLPPPSPPASQHSILLKYYFIFNFVTQHFHTLHLSHCFISLVYTFIDHRQTCILCLHVSCLQSPSCVFTLKVKVCVVDFYKFYLVTCEEETTVSVECN